ncbi:hypothetical protein GCM10027569_37120 [Flindersiella endophytica]
MSTFIEALPPTLGAHAALLRRLLDAVEDWSPARWLILGCSVARGAGDELSDLDVGLGIADGELPGALDRLADLASRCGDVLESLDHRMGEHRHLFVQYANGLQLDLLAMPASARKGYVAGEVVLYDADSGLAAEIVPRAFQVTGEQVREWSFLGWWALGDLAKYLRRGSLWEARQRLDEARDHTFRLWGIAHGVRDATFGLTALLDAPEVGLPAGVEATVAGLDGDDLHRAALATARLLTEAGRRAAARVPAELPAALAEYVRGRLANR